MGDREHLLDLVPIYALGALSRSEAEDLEDHLLSCSSCMDELATHLTTAASLDGDQPPPSGVWERISAAIDNDAPPNAVVRLDERRSRKPRGWGRLIGVAAAVIVVIAGVAFTQLTQVSLLEEPAVIAAAEQAAARDGSIVAEFVAAGTAVARVVLTESGQGFVIPLEALETLEETKTYQLWVINTDEDVISAGAIGNDPVASTFTWTGDVAGFALTREVAGGVVSSAGDVVSVVTDL